MLSPGLRPSTKYMYRPLATAAPSAPAMETRVRPGHLTDDLGLVLADVLVYRYGEQMNPPPGLEATGPTRAEGAEVDGSTNDDGLRPTIMAIAPEKLASATLAYHP